jgi:RND family efflux transporter MFP subunit
MQDSNGASWLRWGEGRSAFHLVGSRRAVFAFVILNFALMAAACTGDAKKNDAAGAAAPVQVGAENVVTVKRDTIVVGPIISGALRPEREATVRAQLGGSMVQVVVQEGQPVQEGALLGRIDARQLDDARQSVQTAVQSAESQVAVAKREADRSRQLVAAGAVAQRDLDLALQNVTNAEAQLADARARLVNADKQVGDAVLRSPLTGIVSRRAVNTGDVVTPGTELFTVIDPSSMRLEASVPSESLSELRVGASVSFSVRGYDQRFEGRIARIVPQADPTTRQVPIIVSIPNTGGRLVAGLFAEGRITNKAADGLVVPINAVNTRGTSPWVLRVNNGKTEQVPVELGLRDDRTERVQLTAGVTEHDVLLRGAAQGITPGTPVNVRAQQE